MCGMFLACKIQGANSAVVQLKDRLTLTQHIFINPPQQSMLIYPAAATCQHHWNYVILVCLVSWGSAPLLCYGLKTTAIQRQIMHPFGHVGNSVPWYWTKLPHRSWKDILVANTVVQHPRSVRLLSRMCSMLRQDNQSSPAL